MSDIAINQVLQQMRVMAARAEGIQQPAEVAGADKVDFSSIMKDSINSVNAVQKESARVSEAFQAGDPNTDITSVMIAMQKANVSFTAMTQVRNKLVDAYQTVMRMGI